MDCVSFATAKSEQSEEIRKFMLDYFYAHEPTNQSYIYGKDPAPEDVEFSIRFLNLGLGVVALSSEGKVVGLSLGYVGELDDAAAMRNIADRSLDEKFRDIMRFLAVIQEGANIQAQFGVTKIYEIQMLAVHPDYCGQSIGTELTKKQIDIAIDRGFEAVYADCSSVYSAKIMEKLGFECVHEIAFADYRNQQGVQIFKTDSIHTGLQSFFKRL
ncbi:arylalkylamine N-acetyltransferase 1-like [Sabethes cyaneus]|uniref:arylalkylamine N-acetyltransferase 1-like n=1 Tax=Sabethes cyaneus TaxID=53552 RepID=UPI00237D485D|nr:arylalkylamine N-acetyltransferase 1-like [Sabethes cyaneus]